jgi:hypothetical protein
LIAKNNNSKANKYIKKFRLTVNKLAP